MFNIGLSAHDAADPAGRAGDGSLVAYTLHRYVRESVGPVAFDLTRYAQVARELDLGGIGELSELDDAARRALALRVAERLGA